MPGRDHASAVRRRAERRGEIGPLRSRPLHDVVGDVGLRGRQDCPTASRSVASRRSGMSSKSSARPSQPISIICAQRSRRWRRSVLAAVPDVESGPDAVHEAEAACMACRDERRHGGAVRSRHTARARWLGGAGRPSGSRDTCRVPTPPSARTAWRARPGSRAGRRSPRSLRTETSPAQHSAQRGGPPSRARCVFGQGRHVAAIRHRSFPSSIDGT